MYRFRCMNYDKIQDVCRIDLDDFKGTCHPFYYIGKLYFYVHNSISMFIVLYLYLFQYLIFNLYLYLSISYHTYI